MKYRYLFLLFLLSSFGCRAVANFVFQDVKYRPDPENGQLVILSGTLSAWTETEPDAPSICKVAGLTGGANPCWIGIGSASGGLAGSNDGVVRLTSKYSVDTALQVRNAWVAENGLPFHFDNVKSNLYKTPWFIQLSLFAGLTEANQGLPFGNYAPPPAPPEAKCDFNQSSLQINYGDINSDDIQNNPTKAPSVNDLSIYCNTDVSLAFYLLDYDAAGVSLRSDGSIKALMTINDHDMSTPYNADAKENQAFSLSVESTLVVPGNTEPESGPFAGHVVLVSSIN
ncbi:hypothetical protein [Rahnella laticis]|uniref:MrpH family fimbial adhesin n=1 Tax=Rahnella laticis TaxID=2787622 RepID=UPI0018A313CE|nr:hypothetical protein [Rahnella laticis]MBF7993683.1 hypothetical protein [Rahnella laticis]